MLLVALVFIPSCGGNHFTGKSAHEGSETGRQNTVEQPTEVSGGFGLTCVAAENTKFSSQLDVSCLFSDKKDQKFRERDDLKLDLQVKLIDQPLAWTMQDASSTSSFTFTVAKNDVDKVQISAKFFNPLNGNEPIQDQTWSLSSLVGSHQLDLEKPKIKSAFLGENGTKVDIEWTSVPNATEYRVYWSNSQVLDKTSPDVNVINVPSTQRVFKIARKRTYVYVAAVKDGSVGPLSNPMTFN